MKDKKLKQIGIVVSVHPELHTLLKTTEFREVEQQLPCAVYESERVARDGTKLIQLGTSDTLGVNDEWHRDRFVIRFDERIIDKELVVDVKLSPVDIGKAFCAMDSEGQVEFLDIVAGLFELDYSDKYMQFLHIADDDALTDRAKEWVSNLNGAISVKRT